MCVGLKNTAPSPSPSGSVARNPFTKPLSATPHTSNPRHTYILATLYHPKPLHHATFHLLTPVTTHNTHTTPKPTPRPNPRHTYITALPTPRNPALRLPYTLLIPRNLALHLHHSHTQLPKHLI